MEWNPYILETLKELGNISEGHAMSVLSQLINTNIRMGSCDIKVMEGLQLFHDVTDKEDEMISILLPFDKDMEGILLFLWKKKFAYHCLKDIFHKDIDFDHLEKEELAMLQEIASIVASSYMEGFATSLNFSLRILLPSITLDMKGAILNEVSSIMARKQQQLLYMQHTFSAVESPDENEIIFLLKEKSFLKLLQALEADR